MPAAQLVEEYNHHAQRMTGTGHAAYSSAVSTGTTTAEPQLYYIHTDHLGTPQELTDRDGNLKWTGHYRAWGELAKATDHSGQTARIEMPLRFQGQYHDAETGLHYNRHRYYDPQLGRFTTQDPISLAGGVNLYQYAPNPVQWVDPLGLSKTSDRGCPNFVFRALTPAEEKSLTKGEGISRPTPHQNTSPAQHVGGVKNHSRNPWISTTRDKAIAEGKYAPGNGKLNKVATIDLDKVDQSKIVDISTPEKAAKHIKPVRLQNYASSDKEVLIHGSIPQEAIIDF